MKARVSNFFGFAPQSSASQQPAVRVGAYSAHEVSLGAGPMGMSLHTVAKCGGLSSAVTVRALERSSEGGAGQAEAAGVRVGDVLVTVAGHDARVLAFAGAMELLRQCPRPVALGFERADVGASARQPSARGLGAMFGGALAGYADVPVTLRAGGGPLGCKLETVVKCGGLQQAVGVKQLTPARSLPQGEPGAAEQAGVRAGDLLAAVGGESVADVGFDEAMAKLQAAARPVVVLFRGRREGAAPAEGAAAGGSAGQLVVADPAPGEAPPPPGASGGECTESL